MPAGFITDFEQQVSTLFGIVPQNSYPYTPTTPFSALYLPEHAILFHLVQIDAAKLQNCPPGFFANWQQKAEENGVRVIQVFEDVWYTRRQNIVCLLTSLAGKSQKIFARNTVIKRITRPVANDFLNAHHLGGSPTARFKYGVFIKKTNELVGAATFSPPRKFYRDGKEYRSYELIRYAGINGANITGGLSKVLKAFIEDVRPDDIMTYADRCWWTGDSYIPLGFEWIENTPPQAFWVKADEWMRYPAHQKPDSERYLQLENAGNRKFLLRLK